MLDDECWVVVVGGLGILNWAVKKCLTAKMTFDSRSKGRLGVSHEGACGYSIPGRGTNTCKGCD